MKTPQWPVVTSAVTEVRLCPQATLTRATATNVGSDQ